MEGVVNVDHLDVVDSPGRIVYDRTPQSLFPTRFARRFTSYVLAQRWWEDGIPFWGHASFGPGNVTAGMPRGLNPNAGVRMNIPRGEPVTYAEAIGQANPGIDYDGWSY